MKARLAVHNYYFQINPGLQSSSALVMEEETPNLDSPIGLNTTTAADLGSAYRTGGGDQPPPTAELLSSLSPYEKPLLLSSLSYKFHEDKGIFLENTVADHGVTFNFFLNDCKQSSLIPFAVGSEEIGEGVSIKLSSINVQDGEQVREIFLSAVEQPGSGTEKPAAPEGSSLRNRKKGNNLPVVKDPSDCTLKGKKKAAYTRKEMEGLRYVNVKGHRKMWRKIYNGFSAEVRKEYDELGSFRRRNERCRSSLKNAAPLRSNTDQGDSCSHDVRCDVEITNSSECARRDTCDDQDGSSVFEEYSEEEEEDSDDYYSTIQRPAFLVDGEPDFESGPPEDGWEYLRRVRWEAAQIPNVKVAKLDESKLRADQSVYMPLIPDIEKCPEHLLPSKQWEDEFLVDFSELRLALWQVVEDISNGASSAIKAAGSGSPEEEEGPALSLLIKMDPVTRINTLKKRISLVVGKKEILRDDCLWLFSLFATVDTPLDADTCAALRALLRKCAKLRAEKSQLDDEAAMLNILVAISGKYFGQFGN